MKRLLPLLVFGAICLGSVQPSFGQMGAPAAAGDGDMGTLHGYSRPTPKPAASVAPGARQPLELSLTKDDKGKKPSAAFTAEDAKVYLQWNDPSAAKGDKISVSWVAEETAGVFPKNKKITESAQVAPGPGAFGTLYLTAPAGGLPPGKYRADVYDGPKLAKSLRFTVTKK